MRIKKLIFLSTVAIIFITSFTGCFMPKAWWTPVFQNQTGTWMSEDGKITISNIGAQADVTIHLENETIEGIIEMQDQPLAVYYKEEYDAYYLAKDSSNILENELEPFEIWDDSIIENDSFYMTVQKTTYFEEGQKIYFHKVAE